MRKVGQALIKAHFYERAVTFYKAAIKTSKHNVIFCYDLANLLFKLKRLEQSKETINSALQSINGQCLFSQEVWNIFLAKFNYFLILFLLASGVLPLRRQMKTIWSYTCEELS